MIALQISTTISTKQIKYTHPIRSDSPTEQSPLARPLDKFKSRGRLCCCCRFVEEYFEENVQHEEEDVTTADLDTNDPIREWMGVLLSAGVLGVGLALCFLLALVKSETMVQCWSVQTDGHGKSGRQADS